MILTNHSTTCLKNKFGTSTSVAIHWFDINEMKSNQAKFQAIILINHPDMSDTSHCVNDINIPLKARVKLQGVFIEFELNFLDHVTYLYNRAPGQLNVVSSMSKYLKKSCLMELVYALLISTVQCDISDLNQAPSKRNKKRKMLCERSLFITLPTIINFWVWQNDFHCSLHSLGHRWLRFSNVSGN